jgi:hypothetical protein
MGHANRSWQHDPLCLDTEPRCLRLCFAGRRAQPNANTYSDGDGDSYRYSDSNTNSYTHGNANTNRDTQSNTAFAPDSASTAHAAVKGNSD